MKNKKIKIILLLCSISFFLILIYLLIPIRINYDYIGELSPNDICNGKVQDTESINYYLSYYNSPPVGLYGVYYYSYEGIVLNPDNISLGGIESLLKQYLDKTESNNVYYLYSYGKPLANLTYKHISRFYKNSNYNKTIGQKYLLNPIYKDITTEPKLFVYQIQANDVHAYDYTLTEPHYPIIKVKKQSGLVDYYRAPYDILYHELNDSINNNS